MHAFAASSTRAFVTAEWVDAGHPRRDEVERFVRDVYRRHHDARLGALMPHLLTFADADDRIMAAVGLRCALEGPLFVERYLDEPAEQRLGRVHGDDVRRESIVEFGNLAAESPGSARALILSMLPVLQDAGLRFVLFVATRQLRNTFTRLGFAPVRLQPADPARLGEDAAQWGRYYESQPDVVAGDLHGVARAPRAPTAWSIPARTCGQPA